ncbi:MAG TPA: hypothetical protein VK272_13630 [Solirubrobacteraceae bacterium]|nr:hypothetical protein [Solirubrobacteraceae bacterium]
MATLIAAILAAIQSKCWQRPRGALRRAIINGAAGLISYRDGRPFSVTGLTVKDGKIVEIDILADPDRLPGSSCQRSMISDAPFGLMLDQTHRVDAKP